MATACPQCGAMVLDGRRSCQFCGARVESAEPAAEESAAAITPAANDAPLSIVPETTPEPAVPAPPVVAVPATAPPAAASPLATSSEAMEPARGKAPKVQAPRSRALSCAATAVIGLVVGWMFLFFGYRLMSAFMGGGISPAVVSKPSSSASTFAGAPTASDLDVDLYPGARPDSDIDRRDSAGETVVSQSFLSGDKMDLVIDFYKARMVGQTSIYASGNGVVVSINPSPQDTVQVGIAPAGNGAGTRIAITHTATKN